MSEKQTAALTRLCHLRLRKAPEPPLRKRGAAGMAAFAGGYPIFMPFGAGFGKSVMDLCDNEEVGYIAGLAKSCVVGSVKAVGSTIAYVPLLLIRSTLRAIGVDVAHPLPAVTASSTRGAIQTNAPQIGTRNVDVELGPATTALAESGDADAEEEAYEAPPEPPPKTLAEIEALDIDDRSIAEMKRLAVHLEAKGSHEERAARNATDDPDTLTIAEMKRRGWH